MRFETYRDEGGFYRWRLRAANNRIIAFSGESFYDKSTCVRAVKLFRKQVLKIYLARIERSR